MSIFGTILSKIFSHAEAAPASPSQDGTPAPAPQGGGAASPSAAPSTAPASAPPAPSTTAGSAPGPSPATPASAAKGPVDVAAVLDKLAAGSKQHLDWKHSIVDMMKLLDLDSSLDARKTLAHELNYTGDTSDSATMNVWLHKQVMQKLAENGGVVPADLKV